MHEYKHSYIYLVNKIYNTSYLQYSHNFITMLTAPPPWTLTGSGVILVAHFSKAFVQSNGFLAPYQQRAYRGWVGTVMAVDYTASPVGPYHPGSVSLRQNHQLLHFKNSRVDTGECLERSPELGNP